MYRHIEAEKQYYDEKMRDGQSVTEYTRRLDMLSDTLEILEEKIDAEEHVIRFTEGLHQSLGAEFIAGLIENPCVSVAEVTQRVMKRQATLVGQGKYQMNARGGYDVKGGKNVSIERVEQKEEDTAKDVKKPVLCVHYQHGNCYNGDKCKNIHMAQTKSVATVVVKVKKPACLYCTDDHEGDACPILACAISTLEAKKRVKECYYCKGTHMEGSACPRAMNAVKMMEANERDVQGMLNDELRGSRKMISPRVGVKAKKNCGTGEEEEE